MADAEKGEELKRGLIEALKHAANIRGLKPEEWIIVTVIGAAPLSYGGAGGSDLGFGPNLNPYVRGVDSSTVAAQVQAGQDASGVDGYGGFGGYGGMDLIGGFGRMGPSSAAVLTMRVKKAAVDNFASGALEAEEFRNQVQIFTH